jgi:hypothetical protein
MQSSVSLGGLWRKRTSPLLASSLQNITLWCSQTPPISAAGCCCHTPSPLQRNHPQSRAMALARTSLIKTLSFDDPTICKSLDPASIEINRIAGISPGEATICHCQKSSKKLSHNRSAASAQF